VRILVATIVVLSSRISVRVDTPFWCTGSIVSFFESTYFFKFVRDSNPVYLDFDVRNPIKEATDYVGRSSI
jgi:hypothetical protein